MRVHRVGKYWKGERKQAGPKQQHFSLLQPSPPPRLIYLTFQKDTGEERKYNWTELDWREGKEVEEEEEKKLIQIGGKNVYNTR